MIPALLAVAIFLTLIYILNYNEKTKMIMKIPGPKHYFLFGNGLGVFMKSPAQIFTFISECAVKFNGIFALDQFLVSGVCVYNPADVEILHTKSASHYIRFDKPQILEKEHRFHPRMMAIDIKKHPNFNTEDGWDLPSTWHPVITSNSKYNTKAWIYIFLKPWLQDGLLLSNGTKWQKRRKILTPAFHFNVLNKYFPAIKSNNTILVENLKKREGGPVNIVPIISDYTLNTICETAMGIKLGKEKTDEAQEYKHGIHNLGDIIINRFVRVWLHPDVLFNLSHMGKQFNKYISTIHKFTRKVIEKRKKNFREANVYKSDIVSNIDCHKKRNIDMLDLLISTQKEGLIDNKGIEEEVDTFMFEGHDTSAAGITYCLLLLANHPDIQNKVAEELNSIFGNDARETTTDDLAAMRYLELCIKESLRLYPPVPFILRQISEPIRLSNYDVPGNVICLISIFHLHRNENVYKDPNKFVPERFLPENSVGRHSYAYIPFSAGPRNCIGQKFAMMEMKSVLSFMLRQFELVPVTKVSDLRFVMNLVLRPTHPIYIKFLKRKQN